MEVKLEEKAKREKIKSNIVKNFFYALKEVYRVDKGFTVKVIFLSIISGLSSFMYAYITKVAVEGIEQKVEFKQVVFNVLIITLIALAFDITIKLIEKDFWFRRDKIAAILSKNFNIESLKTDYEKFERPEAQDSFEKAKNALGSYGGLLELVVEGFGSIGSFITFVIACGIILSVSFWLILAIIFLAILKFFLENYIAKKEKTEFRDKVPTIWRKITYSDNISRNLTIGKDLRIYDMNKFIDNERNNAISSYMKKYKDNEKRKVFFTIIINVCRVLDELFLYAFMIYEVLKNNMDIATFTFMVASVRTLTNAITAIINNHKYILRSSLVVNDYRSFLDVDLNHPGETEEIDSSSIEVEFRNVSYSYYMQEGYALKDVSFTIKRGEKIALVGYNGAGKTTLIKLLCGLYHPTSGQILINGIDIETLKRSSLSKLLAPVFQETMHYAIEVLENVSMEYEDKTNIEKVKDILKLVGLSEKIESLPQKLKTIITRDLDENGIELSGGENQKLAIARAVYKDAPMIILDEPTSALDPLAEYNLYNSFNEICNNHSAIFISHRLSSTKFCDRIIVIDQGKLIEQGTHKELMSKDTKYKELFSMQAEYYKGGDSLEK